MRTGTPGGSVPIRAQLARQASCCIWSTPRASSRCWEKKASIEKASDTLPSSTDMFTSFCSLPCEKKSTAVPAPGSMCTTVVMVMRIFLKATSKCISSSLPLTCMESGMNVFKPSIWTVFTVTDVRSMPVLLSIVRSIGTVMAGTSLDIPAVALSRSFSKTCKKRIGGYSSQSTNSDEVFRVGVGNIGSWSSSWRKYGSMSTAKAASTLVACSATIGSILLHAIGPASL
mmetsp:Transcript_151950/g.487730  ORF Transcript_151950/g.487730 Transcript_151950/m.487730 type:complete len:229 (+) Transcript_151950:1995-2681(+)